MIALLPVGFTGSLGLDTPVPSTGTASASGFATVFDFGYNDGETGTPVTVVATGDSVFWLWTSGIHTVTHRADHATDDLLPPEFDSGVVRAHDDEPFFSTVFDTPGVYEYYCALHPSMRGTVVVA